MDSTSQNTETENNPYPNPNPGMKICPARPGPGPTARPGPARAVGKKSESGPPAQKFFFKKISKLWLVFDSY